MTDSEHVYIQVITTYLAEQSNPDAQQFAFAYTITIANTGKDAVQLLSRHWLITDANANVQEVKGDGVIGEQPVILPGHEFTYTSGAVLNTSIGSMHGSYLMLHQDGSTFNVPIPAFSLHKPGQLH